jgi:hypothetical protein
MYMGWITVQIIACLSQRRNRRGTIKCQAEEQERYKYLVLFEIIDISKSFAKLQTLKYLAIT